MAQRGENKRDHLPPLDKKEIEKLRKEASTAKLSVASFKEHKNKFNEASWNKNSG